MTIVELDQTVQEHVYHSVDELADSLYFKIKSALDAGADRRELYGVVREYYDVLTARRQTVARRAVGELLAHLDGFSFPLSAL